MCIAGVGFRPEKKFYIKVAFRFLKKTCYRRSFSSVEMPRDNVE